MKKKHIIALIIAAVVTALVLPLGYFDISPDNKWVNVFGMVVTIVGAVAAIAIGTTDPSEDHAGDH